MTAVDNDTVDGNQAFTLVIASAMDDDLFGLRDAIFSFQILAGIEPSSAIHKEADVNGDGKIGLAEVI